VNIDPGILEAMGGSLEAHEAEKRQAIRCVGASASAEHSEADLDLVTGLECSRHPRDELGVDASHKRPSVVQERLVVQE
jgi:hypothetical protein